MKCHDCHKEIKKDYGFYSTGDGMCTYGGWISLCKKCRISHIAVFTLFIGVPLGMLAAIVIGFIVFYR
jgi:hypothetical protein